MEQTIAVKKFMQNLGMASGIMNQNYIIVLNKDLILTNLNAWAEEIKSGELKVDEKRIQNISNDQPHLFSSFLNLEEKSGLVERDPESTIIEFNLAVSMFYEYVCRVLEKEPVPEGQESLNINRTVFLCGKILQTAPVKTSPFRVCDFLNGQIALHFHLFRILSSGWSPPEDSEFNQKVLAGFKRIAELADYFLNFALREKKYQVVSDIGRLQAEVLRQLMKGMSAWNSIPRRDCIFLLDPKKVFLSWVKVSPSDLKEFGLDENEIKLLGV